MSKAMEVYSRPAQEGLAQDEAGFSASAREEMRELEAEWVGAAERFAWVDPGPTWASATDWDLYVFDAQRCPQACKRIYRFSLTGGGQLTAIERYRQSDLVTGQEPSTLLERTDRTITAHTPCGLRRYAGRIDGFHNEMTARAVVSRTAPQDIIDRAAATLRALEGEVEHFYALLDGATGCAICGRPLRDEVSKLCAVGPDCARKLGIPHSTTAANKRLELRRQLLTGSSP